MTDQPQTATTATTAMTATEYRALIATAFPDATKPQICAALDISRPTHDAHLAQGIQSLRKHKSAHDMRDHVLERTQAHADALTAQAERIMGHLRGLG